MTVAVSEAPDRTNPGATAIRGGGLDGLGLTAGLVLRRNRWFWMLWIVALVGTIAATAAAYQRLLPTGANASTLMADLAGNPTMRAMLGPPFDLGIKGGFVMWRVGTFVAAAAGVMAVLGVIRATRAEEEDGRVELLRSAAVGRHVPLLAAVLVGLGGCLLMAILIVVVLAVQAPPFAGAVAVGVGIGLVGAVFVGVGAVAAQISESARTARGLGLSVLGAAYLVRAVADGSAASSGLRSLNWVSPLDWAALVRPYATERWWVMGLPLGLAVSLIALAFRLEATRDHGAGLRAARLGPPRGASYLSSATGLAWRLQRSSVVGWFIGISLFALAIGSLSGSFDNLLRDSPQLADMFRRVGAGASDLRQAFYVAMLGIMVVIIAAAGVAILGRLGREEDRGTAEAMLATGTTRTRFASSHLLPALVAPTVLLLLTGCLMAVPQALSDRSTAIIATELRAALALAPGPWLTVSIAMLLYGWWPRLFGLVWAVIGWSLLMVWIGELLNLPQALIDATPFATLPQVPVEPFTWTPWLIETALSVAAVVLGLIGYRRRDIG